MKKAITVIALLVINTLTFAGKPLKVLSGDIGFLKEDAVAKVEMDYSQTTWENRSSYEAFCGEEYEDRMEQSKVAFISGFNTTSKTFKIADTEQDTKYTIIVHVNYLERKVYDIAEFYIRVIGTISVVNNETGEEVCQIEINKLAGNASYVPNVRLYNCFQTLGSKLAKMK